MNKIYTYFIVLILCSSVFLVTRCSSNDNNETEDITKVKIYKPDYDNGDTIYMNVKIAIDEEGWNSKSPDYFKTELKKQWAEITTRFNSADKQKQLKRYYVFAPDLQDIQIYKGCSYWNGKNGDRLGANNKVLANLDKDIFQTVVIYDFFYNGSEAGEYGGGCANEDGINTILVINASEEMKNKYNDHFGIYTYRAITHELGHARGCIDLYAEIVEAENNPISGQGFIPPHCLMNDMCYTDDAASYWSDYAIKIINYTGVKKLNDIVNKTMYDTFAKEISISVTKNQKPQDAIIKFYPVIYQNGANLVRATPQYTFQTKEGKYTNNDLKTLVFGDNAPSWGRWSMFLIEVGIQSEKKYQWLNDYSMQVTGLEGKNIHEMTFDF